MAVAGGDEQISVFTRQRTQRRRVGIEQRLQDRRERGFCRSLLADQHQHGIRTTIAQTREQKRHHEHEIAVRGDVEEVAQALDRPALLRHWQRLHAGSAAEAYRRLVDNPPAGGVDLHSLPGIITKIEIELSVGPRDANMNATHRRVELGLGLDDIQSGLQSLRVWRTGSCLEKTPCQPPAKSFAADRPGFAMAVDVEIGEAGPVRCMEKIRRLRESDENGGLFRGRSTVISTLIDSGIIDAVCVRWFGRVFDIGCVLNRLAVALRLARTVPAGLLGVVEYRAGADFRRRRVKPMLPALVTGALIEF